MTTRATPLFVGLLTIAVAAHAAVGGLDSLNALPPVITDTTQAPACTVTWLVTNIATNDTFAVRMRITPDKDDQPVNHLMPCPRDIPPRVASRALDACILRAADPKDCVFSDMARGFEKRPNVDNTSEAASRCASDKASDIGLACWRADGRDICGIGCGNNPDAAIAAAVSRCEAKHQRQCPITGSLPVLAPR